MKEPILDLENIEQPKDYVVHENRIVDNDPYYDYVDTSDIEARIQYVILAIIVASIGLVAWLLS